MIACTSPIRALTPLTCLTARLNQLYLLFSPPISFSLTYSSVRCWLVPLFTADLKFVMAHHQSKHKQQNYRMPLSAPETTAVSTGMHEMELVLKKNTKVGKRHNEKCSIYQTIGLQMQIRKGSLRKQVVRRCKIEKLSGWSRDSLEPPSTAQDLGWDDFEGGERQIDRHRN